MENNKADFEKALTEMKDVIELLDQCVAEDLMNKLNAVVNEYEGHYQSDIEDLIDAHDTLKDELQDIRLTGVC
jgi:hypothetical protein